MSASESGEGEWHDGKWHCEICHAHVEGVGPWCDLYNGELRGLCRPLTVKLLKEADARGDGSMVNALCWYGRSRWGPSLFW